MLMRYSAFNRAHPLLTRLKFTLGALSAVAGACLKADVAKIESQLGAGVASKVEGIQLSAWWLIPTLILAIPVVGLLQRGAGNPRVWGIVHSVLNSYRKDIFGKPKNDGEHMHRVTLFEYRHWVWCCRRWPWSGWLVPVERSGHTTRHSSSRFKAPDEADLAEGVAGKSWCGRNTCIVEDLPDLSADSSEEALKRYADASWMRLKDVRKRKPQARSLYGFPVKVDGKQWGAIVIDSRRSTLPVSKIKKHIKMVARFLGWTLENP